MLKLEIQILEKKKKLKRLQARKEMRRKEQLGLPQGYAEDGDIVEKNVAAEYNKCPDHSNEDGMVGNSSTDVPVTPRTPPRKKRKSETEYEVGQSPSPVKRNPSGSPIRVILGVDKGLRAEDVSLKPKPKPKPHPGPSTVQQQSTSKTLVGPSFSDRLITQRKVLQSKLEETQTIKSKRLPTFSLSCNVGKAHEEQPESEERVSQDENYIYEKYTKFRLTKRYLDEERAEKEFEDKEILGLKKLFAVISPPDFETPRYPNFIVMGIIARKSEIKQNKLNHKYVMITLTDLNYEVELAIHGEAFEKYWKLLLEGTLIAVLNPDVYTKNIEGAKSFGISVTSSYDVILEIGYSKDFAKCQAITQKGHKCNQWVDSRRNIYCDYHVELGVKRTGRGRTELNSSQTKMFSPKKSNGQKMQFYHGPSSNGQTDLLPDYARGHYTREHGTVYVSNSKSLFLDDSLQNKQQVDQILKLQKQKAEAQRITREKLASLPNGHMLRDYDSKGKIIQKDDEQNINVKETNEQRLFTPEQVRKIGFDPTKRQNEPSKDQRIGKVSPGKVTLRKHPKSVVALAGNTNDDDDDDELDII